MNALNVATVELGNSERFNNLLADFEVRFNFHSFAVSNFHVGICYIFVCYYYSAPPDFKIAGRCIDDHIEIVGNFEFLGKDMFENIHQNFHQRWPVDGFGVFKFAEGFNQIHCFHNTKGVFII